MQRVLTMVSLGDLVAVTAAEEQISTITDLHPAWKKIVNNVELASLHFDHKRMVAPE